MLSNTELILLQLIAQNPNITGYNLNKLIKIYDYGSWTGLKQSSIYNSLKSITKKELISAVQPTEKVGKGPLPKILNITQLGSKQMKCEMLKTISSNWKDEQRFSIIISALQLLQTKEVKIALDARKIILGDELLRLENEYSKHYDFLKLGGVILYERLIEKIKFELKFSQKIKNICNVNDKEDL